MRHELAIWRNFAAYLKSRQSVVPPDNSEFERSTDPTAIMNLFIRIETSKGPRTVIAPSVPLGLASDLSEAIIGTGHYAEFVDRCRTLTIAERLAQTNGKRPEAAQGDAVEPVPKSNPISASSVTPMQFASVLVFEEEKKCVRRMRWGIAPASAASGNRGAQIHAKAETIDTLLASADGCSFQRGLLLVRDTENSGEIDLRKMRPHSLVENDGGLRAIAVLWERSSREEREDLLSFVVITVPNSKDTPDVDLRKPAVIDPPEWDSWLGQIAKTPAELKSLLLPRSASHDFLSTTRSG